MASKDNASAVSDALINQMAIGIEALVLGQAIPLMEAIPVVEVGLVAGTFEPSAGGLLRLRLRGGGDQHHGCEET
ncbi:MAG: hypothetical protein JKY00_02215 [Roseicyclus sp.]|nr:hypothetical protein [Roseicyclus sp.]